MHRRRHMSQQITVTPLPCTLFSSPFLRQHARTADSQPGLLRFRQDSFPNLTLGRPLPETHG